MRDSNFRPEPRFRERKTQGLRPEVEPEIRDVTRGTCMLPEIHESPITTQLVFLVILYLNLVTFSASILQFQFTFLGSEGWGRKSGFFFFENCGGTGVSYLSLPLMEGPHHLLLMHINLTEVCKGNMYFHPKNGLRVYYSAEIKFLWQIW